MRGEEKPDELLKVENIHVDVEVRGEDLKIIDGVSFVLKRGETLGVVGESGAGKSMLGNAIAGLLEPPLRVSNGQVHFEGSRIDNLKGEAARRLRGRRIGMVFQDPLTSLDPLFTVGAQIIETIRTHADVSHRKARQLAVGMLEQTGIPEADVRIDQYPHQFSGGMRQRVVLALALCANPQLIIADEPTTALDVSVQAQILRLLEKLCSDNGSSVILITHDMGVIAEVSDRVAVMYAGRIVEIGPTRDVIKASRHPYTRGLMASIPPLDHRPERLEQIEGNMPKLGRTTGGCSFYDRCSVSVAKCKDAVPSLTGDQGHKSACWLQDKGDEA